MSKNEYIASLKQSYEEAIAQLDSLPMEMIKGGSDMAGLMAFHEKRSAIFKIYETAKDFYTIIYQRQDVLKHYKSGKLGMKFIPLEDYYKEDKVNPEDVEKYGQELRKNYSKFVDERDNFDDKAFIEYLVASQLHDAGYKKRHWYFKPTFINTVEYLLDFLLEFVEVGFNPVSEEPAESESPDRHIAKAVKMEVWRRDLGKCVQCGSKEKLEYDHIIPVSRGGSNTARNVQLLCEKCNRTKSDAIQ